MAENRQDRLLMRQRGAGTRQIKDLDFQLILPGVPGIVTLPPKERASETSWRTAEANPPPQCSPRETPQPTLPLLQSSSTPSATSLQKRKPGRQPKPRLAPTVNQDGLPNSIPTQSDGEGSVTKKRRVVLETSDQENNTSGGITITNSLVNKESSTKVGQAHVSRHKDTCTVSPLNLGKGRTMSELACQALEKETGLRTDDGGGNQLLLENEASGSAKHVSQVLNISLENKSQNIAMMSGQHLQIEQLQGIEKVAQPSGVRNEEEGSVIIPPLDENIKPRPTRRKRTFIGEVQRFASEATEVLKQGNLVAVADSVSGGVEKYKASPKNPEPRGPRKKLLSVIGQGSTAEENLQSKKPRKPKSSMQSSQSQGCLEKLPRKRGRPRKIVPPVCEGGDPEEISHGVKLNEGDLGEQRSQIINPHENSPMETEEQPNESFKGEVIDLSLQDISHSPRLDGSECGAQIVNLHGNPPLETKEQPPEVSLSLGEVSHPSNKSYNTGLDESENGMQFVDPLGHSESKTQGRLQNEPRLQGDSSDPPGASYSSRLYGSEFGTQIVDPCEILSSGTQGQSPKVSTFQGQASYSPGIFYSAILGESEFNAKSVNPLRNPPLKTQEHAQKTLPPQSDVGGSPCISYCTRPSESECVADPSQIQSPFGNLKLLSEERRLTKFLLPVGKETGRKGVKKPNKTVSDKRLPLLQRQTINKSSRGMGDPKRIIVPALEETEKEGGSRRMEVYNDELSTEALRIRDSSTNQLCQSEVGPKQLQALEKGQQNDNEPLSREGPDPQNQRPNKKRGGRKKQKIPDAGLPSKTERAKKGSREESPLASLKPSHNPIPIIVCRLSCDRGKNATANVDPVVFIQDKYLTAVDVMAQICHEFAMKSQESVNHVMHSRLRNPLKAELKRKLEVSEDGGGTLDRWLFQLDILDNQIASSTQADKIQGYGTALQAELEVHEPETPDISPQERQNGERGCMVQEPEYLTALLKSIETAVIRGREIDAQRSADAASHHDHMLNIRSLETMLQHTANGISVGEGTGTGIWETLKEFNGVLERTIATW